MRFIVFFPIIKGNLLGERLHFLILKDNEGLIGWRIDKEAIAACGKDLTQTARGFYSVFAEAKIKIIRKERIKLQTEQTPLGEKRAVLLDTREEMEITL